MKYSDIYLTKREIQHLNLMSDGRVIRLHTVDTENLLKYNLISVHNLSNCSNNYVITPNGLKYVEYLQSIKKEKQSIALHEWVNTFIALVALIISAISLFK